VLDDLKSQYRRILLVFDGEPPRELADFPGADHVRRRGRTASLLAHADVEGVVDRIRGLRPLSVEVRPITLKELFLDHVKGE
jgi:ABC-2 type transport system ATP-binding protein